MSLAPLQRTTTATVEMRPAPIDPSWVVEGSPMARVGAVSRSADGLSWTDIWDCTEGRFVWRYDVDETVHILEGGAHVVDANGTHWDLRPGDVVSFRVGTQASWHVPRYVRKVAFCSEVVPKPLTALIDVERRLRGRSKPLAAAVAGLFAMTMAAGVMMAE
ncbi:MAG: DUF861 domain-containing protein [Alphaproteobacteria bacterium]|nr:DUF861 domain-containing protein [Alphaproteobacteria bacterium]MCW5738631.1 DUF861 domain-containing protein [Alphaproteobacteria bacterium]